MPFLPILISRFSCLFFLWEISCHEIPWFLVSHEKLRSVLHMYYLLKFGKARRFGVKIWALLVKLDLDDFKNEQAWARYIWCSLILTITHTYIGRYILRYFLQTQWTLTRYVHILIVPTLGSTSTSFQFSTLAT